MNDYGVVAGTILNMLKSVILVLGDADQRAQLLSSPRDSPLELFRWLEDGDACTHLGVPIGNDIDDRVEEHWQARERLFIRRLSRWFRIPQTFRTRVMVMKTMAMSVLWYSLCYMECPPELLKRLQTACDRFVWRITPLGGASSRQPLCAQRNIAMPMECGGLGAWSIQSMIDAFRIKWYIRMMADSCPFGSRHQARWAILAKFVIIHRATPHSDLSLSQPDSQQSSLLSWSSTRPQRVRLAQTKALLTGSLLFPQASLLLLPPVWRRALKVWKAQATELMAMVPQSFSQSDVISSLTLLRQRPVSTLRLDLLSPNDRSLMQTVFSSPKWPAVSMTKQLWCHLWRADGVLPAARDISWMALRNVLRTAKQLRKMQVIPNGACSMCSPAAAAPLPHFVAIPPTFELDTPIHVLCECPHATREFWADVTGVVRAITRSPNWTPPHYWAILGQPVGVSQAEFTVNLLRSSALVIFWREYKATRLSTSANFPLGRPVVASDILAKWKVFARDLLSLHWFSLPANQRPSFMYVCDPLFVSVPDGILCHDFVFSFLLT